MILQISNLTVSGADNFVLNGVEYAFGTGGGRFGAGDDKTLISINVDRSFSTSSIIMGLFLVQSSTFGAAIIISPYTGDIITVDLIRIELLHGRDARYTTGEN